MSISLKLYIKLVLIFPFLGFKKSNFLSLWHFDRFYVYRVKPFKIFQNLEFDQQNFKKFIIDISTIYFYLFNNPFAEIKKGANDSEITSKISDTAVARDEWFQVSRPIIEKIKNAVGKLERNKNRRHALKSLHSFS